MAPDNWSRVIHVSGGPEIKAWFEKYLHPQHAIEHPLQMGCMQTLHWRFPLKKHQKCFVDEETSLDFLLSWGEYMMTTSSFLGEPAGYGLSHDITSSTQSVTATNTFYASTNNHAVNIQESAKSPPTHTHTHTHTEALPTLSECRAQKTMTGFSAGPALWSIQVTPAQLEA